MRLDLCTWPEVEAYQTGGGGVILPVGSTEQHGPMGLIGTDALCAAAIAERAADRAGAMVAPVLAYTPAPFNTGFPGTVSVPVELFQSLFSEVAAGLLAQGFARLYVLNAHGANLAPMAAAAAALEPRFGAGRIRLRSWWDFETVNARRRALYGDWEGLHATPSEIAITQKLFRTVPPGAAAEPPRQLSPEEIAARAGDRHGSPEAHRAEFPDGRVGAHSALARPEDGALLLDAAERAVARDYCAFMGIAAPAG